MYSNVCPNPELSLKIGTEYPLAGGIMVVRTVLLQYCAKVMQTYFAEIRPLFSQIFREESLGLK